MKEVMADAEVHLSTQANMTNFRTAQFWVKMGVKRLVLARELTLEEITGIREHLPDDVELESFVHGAMCISYSGRCLLSNFMVERDSKNRGSVFSALGRLFVVLGHPEFRWPLLLFSAMNMLFMAYLAVLFYVF